MNIRERFLGALGFEPGVRAPLWEWGYWGGTIERWYGEGLPRVKGLRQPAAYGDTVAGPGAAWGSGVLNVQRAEDVSDYLGFDPPRETIPLQNFIYPPFAPAVLREDAEHVVVRDEMGIVSQQRRDGASKPLFLAWPISDRASWEALKRERLQPDTAARLPADWPQRVRAYRERSYPLSIGSGYCGFFGPLRSLLGEERLLYAFYDEPELVHDILDHLCELWIALYSTVLQDVQADSAEFWEDMAYRNGSLISPAAFRTFMMPRYKRLIGALRERGVRHFCVDTDGDCWELIPLFIECGITAMLPFEVQAGMDIVEVRRRYPTLGIYGGLDKRALVEGRGAIERELDKATVLLRQGGYIPLLDHLTPPDVPWDSYVYFRRRLAEIAEAAAR